MPSKPTLLVIDSPNFDWDANVPALVDGLRQYPGIVPTVTKDKSVLEGSGLEEFQVVLIGSGFYVQHEYPDGSVSYSPELSESQAEGLLGFVRNGGGFVGMHTTGWAIDGEFFALIGGHANRHPAFHGELLEVRLANGEHPITKDVRDFTVPDECYLSAWSPSIDILATTDWQTVKGLPMAWTNVYGRGRVFYTALGHAPPTLEHPMMRRLLGNAVLWVAGTR